MPTQKGSVWETENSVREGCFLTLSAYGKITLQVTN